MSEIAINPSKLHQELLSAGFPVVGVASDGRIDYSRDLTASENKAVQSLIAAHDPTPSTSEARLEAYFKAGITLQDMIFALWSKVVQGDTTQADKIQAIMGNINATIN